MGVNEEILTVVAVRGRIKKMRIIGCHRSRIKRTLMESLNVPTNHICELKSPPKTKQIGKYYNTFA